MYLCVLVPFLLFFAQANVAGEWWTTLTTPGGDMEFKLVINQQGTKLTGRMTSDMGEFSLEGVVNGDQVKLEWSFPDGGRPLAVVFTGKIQGNALKGFAKLGNVGEGSMSAQRLP